MKEPFLERLAKGPVLMDGAMGTMLHSLDVPKGECLEHLNLVNPGIVRSVHNEYAKAKAEIITTNTFGANRHILSYFGLADSVENINREAVNIVRALGGDLYIAGSVGPVSRPYENIKTLTRAKMRSIFREQIQILLAQNVDIIKFETFSSLSEIVLAFETLRELDARIPAFCLLSFVENGKTLNGVSPKDAFRELSRSGSPINGANCGIGPQSTYQIVNQITTFSRYSVIQPNAGQPVFHSGKFIYPVTPDYYAVYTKRFLEAGVDIIGGCCGTTPAHIKKAGEIMKMPFKVKKAALPRKERTDKTVKFVKFPNSFKDSLKNGFTVTVEVDPPKGIDNTRTYAYIKALREAGVAAVNIADNPLGKLRQSISAVSFVAKREIGMDVIIHFSCRDKNLIGIQAELLSLYSLGINNLLAITGDPPSVGDYPFATAVYEVNSSGLIEIVSNLNKGTDYLGNQVPARTDFFIGAAAGMDICGNKEAFKHLGRKIAKGAGFIQTQPVYSFEEAAVLSKMLNKTKKPFILGILPLVSYAHAEFLANEIHGVKVPGVFLSKLEKAKGDDAMAISLDYTADMISKIKGIANGICIMTPFNRYSFVLELLKRVNDS